MNLLSFNKKVLEKVAPIAFGYFIIGIACGMLGEKAGLNPFEMFTMSVLAYAGSSQFIGIAMIIQGASLLSIGLTIIIVNLRYVLFSSTLMKYLKEKSFPYLALFGHGITDESFAVNLTAFEKEIPVWTHSEALSINFIGCIAWSFSTALGCYASEFINFDGALANYILTAMFFGIWSNYLIERKMIVIGLTAGILATLMAIYIPYKLHIVLATLIVSGLASYLSLKYEGGATHE